MRKKSFVIALGVGISVMASGGSAHAGNIGNGVLAQQCAQSFGFPTVGAAQQFIHSFQGNFAGGVPAALAAYCFIG